MLQIVSGLCAGCHLRAVDTAVAFEITVGRGWYRGAFEPFNVRLALELRVSVPTKSDENNNGDYVSHRDTRFVRPNETKLTGAPRRHLPSCSHVLGTIPSWRTSKLRTK